MPERAAPDPLYVASRRVLLDALEALSAQRRAAILVGAHAVYLRVGEGDLATTPHTTDADLALDPSLLGGDPLLNEALVAAGFWPKTGASGPVVGSWVTEQKVEGRSVHVDLDLLVPEAVSGDGTRAARLGVQGNRLARKAFGLELALVDNDVMSVGALDSDQRSFPVRVAGVAALLVAKVHKVAERLDDPKRDDYIAKDALDMLRLLRGSDIDSMARVLSLQPAHPSLLQPPVNTARTKPLSPPLACPAGPWQVPASSGRPAGRGRRPRPTGRGIR